jgi:uncharacterized protein
MPTNALPWLDVEPPSPRVIFLGPLDSILWDRKAVMQLFDFDYIWEVYKPLEQRRWGYYILPVFYGDHFIARMDSRLEGKTWIISRWWEPDAKLNAELLEALKGAVEKFLYYLRADDIRAGEEVEGDVRKVIVGTRV